MTVFLTIMSALYGIMLDKYRISFDKRYSKCLYLLNPLGTSAYTPRIDSGNSDASANMM